MLKQRVITAVVLLLVLIPALLYPDPRVFAALALLFIGAAGWEWARLNACANRAAMVAGLACVLVCIGLWWLGGLSQPMATLWWISGVSWVVIGARVLRGGVPAWQTYAPVLRLVLGLAALCLTWLAVAQARHIGINFLLSVLALVWVADIAAYFAGRAFGGRFTRSKLAVTISPGKSWEGVWGGMVGVLVLAALWRYGDGQTAASVPSLYTHLGRFGLGVQVLAVVFLAAMSVVGDLLESLVKRSAGVKDSSALLPGHGGVLDRIDALLPTLPLAMMLYGV